eukprot:CAMPEP_0174332746 /NCGR_PEP_ID=MMETSP0810-20121108/18552_1 /TAXON_ID=73025 ORGANISM="Eutreptiella gymnastica-like, Strain CCMP1594" /NCGR_SAMPLE_ID=MMETSP0810 /ASSEMBLY_ACC=CAM_ASM_000659 /LENGTH=104 /DNA_ID=CAMNT_0015449355 /DNA_START=234 /DNA_END=545 /DNA_ORIENTATION=-
MRDREQGEERHPHNGHVAGAEGWRTDGRTSRQWVAKAVGTRCGRRLMQTLQPVLTATSLPTSICQSRSSLGRVLTNAPPPKGWGVIPLLGWFFGVVLFPKSSQK